MAGAAVGLVEMAARTMSVVTEVCSRYGLILLPEFLMGQAAAQAVHLMPLKIMAS